MLPSSARLRPEGLSVSCPPCESSMGDSRAGLRSGGNSGSMVFSDPVWNIGTTRRAVRPMSVREINVSKVVISDRT